LGAPAGDHAIYLSVIQIQQNAPGEPADMQVKVFKNDLESALRNAFPDYVPVPLSDIYPQYADQIEAYFGRHLLVTINGTRQRASLHNCRAEGDTFWLDMRLPDAGAWHRLDVKADFFMELFPTQSNVLNVSVGGQQQFCRLTREAPSCGADF